MDYLIQRKLRESNCSIYTMRGVSMFLQYRVFLTQCSFLFILSICSQHDDNKCTFSARMPNCCSKKRSRCRSNGLVLHRFIWHLPSGQFSQQQHHHHQPSTESSTITPIHSQPQSIFYATLFSSLIDRTACPRNNGISGRPSQGSQHPDFQLGLELNSRSGKHDPSQLPTQLQSQSQNGGKSWKWHV